jgi:hypothetical protein
MRRRTGSVADRVPEEAHLFTPSEVAEILGVSVGTLANWRVYGTGPKFLRVNGGVRYAKTDLLRFLEAGREAAAAKPARPRRGRPRRAAV